MIELASAAVLMWRLAVELRQGRRFSESAERAASRAAGALLFALAAYVTIVAIWSLWTRTGEAFSWPGFIVALAAIPSMRWLALRKIAIAEKLGSQALRADAMEAVTCGWLSVVVVVSSRRSVGVRRLVDRQRRLARDRLVPHQGRPGGLVGPGMRLRLVRGGRAADEFPPRFNCPASGQKPFWILILIGSPFAVFRDITDNGSRMRRAPP